MDFQEFQSLLLRRGKLNFEPCTQTWWASKYWNNEAKVFRDKQAKGFVILSSEGCIGCNPRIYNWFDAFYVATFTHNKVA